MQVLTAPYLGSRSKKVAQEVFCWLEENCAVPEVSAALSSPACHWRKRTINPGLQILFFYHKANSLQAWHQVLEAVAPHLGCYFSQLHYGSQIAPAAIYSVLEQWPLPVLENLNSVIGAQQKKPAKTILRIIQDLVLSSENHLGFNYSWRG